MAKGKKEKGTLKEGTWGAHIGPLNDSYPYIELKITKNVQI